MRKLLDNKVFQFIYGIIKGFIVGLLILYVGVVILQRLTNNASIFGYRVFTVASGSMDPVYKVNDVILVENIDESEIKIGDDLAYKSANDVYNGLIVTHRLVRTEVNEKGETRYYLKGLNNEYEDPSIASYQILGKVKGKVPVVNLVNHVVKNMYGFFFLVFCPLVLVIFLEVADTIVEIKVERNELREIKKNKYKDKDTESGMEDTVEGDNDEEVI